jgi:hypothetical protein
MIDPQLRDFFRQKGISIEALDTVRPSHSSALSLSLLSRRRQGGRLVDD